MCNLDKILIKYFVCLAFLVLTLTIRAQAPLIKISSDHRRFETAEGKAFSWIGDTGWLLFNKTTREEALHYLRTRKKQGFNVIQVMVLHDMPNNVNKYGDSAVHQQNIAKPFITTGSDPIIKEQYDFWDHVEYIIKEADKLGLQMALVPLWGSNMKLVKPTEAQIVSYGKFLAERFRHYPNIIWLIGGDVAPAEYTNLWEKLALTIKQADPIHLMTYHPRGRFTSGDFFHEASWLDFNMFQSGHKRYDQDTSAKDIHHFGEDNWRYVEMDMHRSPLKPCIDGEPSYENIPHGLHDSLERRWTDLDIRRYAYWSILAGAPGFTYGENAVMQFHHPGDWDHNFGVTTSWKKALYAPGALQMKHVKQVMSFFGDKSWRPLMRIAGSGERYMRIAAAFNENAIVFYIHQKRVISLPSDQISPNYKSIFWMDPITGNKVIANGKIMGGIWYSGGLPTSIHSKDILLVIQQK